MRQIKDIINQYDTYPSWVPAFAAESGYVSSNDTRTRGMKTAERLALLPAGIAPSDLTSSNTAAKESRAFYYDARGRVVQLACTNAQGGTDRISTSYGFAGNVLKERQKIQPASGASSYNLDRVYTYDARLRLTNVTATLNGGTSASQTLTYDYLQRPASVTRGNSAAETTAYSYTLQGWPNTVISTSWEEVMFYANPAHSAVSGLPGKAGLVTEWRQQHKGTTANGASANVFYAYAYDKAGRLTGSVRYPAGASTSDNVLTEQGITYDRSGNLKTLNRYGSSGTVTQSLSYTNGQRRDNWSYDNHGNVTYDAQSSLTLAWNVLDMPRTLTSGSASTQRAYLADGTLAQVYDGSTTRLYLGDMVFTRTGTSGTPVLESAGWEGGRLVNGSGTDKIFYYVTDHLGSVRVVKDGSGTIRQRFDYYPFGATCRSWTSSSTTDNSEKRFRFGGKEIAGTALTELSGAGASPGAPYLDFGARLYSPRTATWLSVDPMAEKYYGIGPLAYCAGNPVNLVDPTGEDWYQGIDTDRFVFIEGDKEVSGYKNVGETMSIQFEEEGVYANCFQNAVVSITKEPADAKSQILSSKALQGQYLSNSSPLSDYSKQSLMTGIIHQGQTDFLNHPVTKAVGMNLGGMILGGILETVSSAISFYSAQESFRITFGRDANQAYHAFRHIDELGLSRKSVSKAIYKDVLSVYNDLPNKGIIREILYKNQTLRYGIMKFSDGSVNIGKIYNPAIPR